MRKYLCTLLAGLACAGAALAASTPQPVGLTRANYTDTSRAAWGQPQQPRPLATAIWYPAAPGTPQKDMDIAIFRVGSNALDGPMAASPARLPLILLSHGTGGSAASFAWLAQALAAQGYMVAALNHHGNTGAEAESHVQGFVTWWERPRDLSVLLDKLLADPRFGPRIDPARVGIAGFSIGGYSVLAAVGARLNHPQYDAFCKANPASALCVLPPETRGKASMDDVQQLLNHDPQMLASMAHMEDAYGDARFRAAFAIAPVMGPALTTASLKAIQVPVSIVVGGQDPQAVPSVNAQPMAAAIPSAQLQILPGVTHYTFLSTCTLPARLFAREFCVDPGSLDRDAVHDQVAARAVEFFGATLKAK